jgi:hypothetical protein
MPQAAPHLFQRAAEVALGVSFNAQSQAPDIPGASSRALFSRHTASLQANPRSRIYTLAHIPKSFCPPSTSNLKLPTIRPKLYFRIFISCRCAHVWKSSRLLLTSNTKLLMIFTPRIDSVFHVFSFENSHHCRPELLRLPTKQDVSHFSLQLVSQDSAQELFLRTIDPYRGFSRTEDASFSFVVYGLLFVKVCFVFIVLAWEVPGLLR